jgi:hypothetical protein
MQLFVCFYVSKKEDESHLKNINGLNIAYMSVRNSWRMNRGIIQTLKLICNVAGMIEAKPFRLKNIENLFFKNKSDSLRLFAANTIYRAGGSEAVVFLKKAAIKDPGIQVRQQALENLFLLDQKEAQKAGVRLLKIYK